MHRKLTITVSNSDSRFMPKIVTVEAGKMNDQVMQEINRVNIPVNGDGTYEVLGLQTQFYSVIQIYIKEVHAVSDIV